MHHGLPEVAGVSYLGLFMTKILLLGLAYGEGQRGCGGLLRISGRPWTSGVKVRSTKALRTNDP